MLDEINAQTPPIMCDKIKPVHTKGSEFTKIKKKNNSLMCFYCHPQIVLAELSQDNKRKYEK
jgi:hypothetical protein